MDCHFIGEKVQDQTIKLFHVFNNDMVADILTKALVAPLFSLHHGKLSMNNIHAPKTFMRSRSSYATLVVILVAMMIVLWQLGS